MQVTILGSGSPMVTADRAGPSTLVRIGKTDLLFDCGRAVLMRGIAAGMTARELAAVFVTHMHSDHTTDYNDVITTRWITNTEPRPLTAIGPVGFKVEFPMVKRFISGWLSNRFRRSGGSSGRWINIKRQWNSKLRDGMIHVFCPGQYRSWTRWRLW